MASPSCLPAIRWCSGGSPLKPAGGPTPISKQPPTTVSRVFRHAQMPEAGGSMVAFSIKGGRDAAYAMLNKLALVDISNNLGDAKSLITQPSITTHRTLTEEERAAIGLDDTWVRLSVGLEDPHDIVEDIEQAL